MNIDNEPPNLDERHLVFLDKLRRTGGDVWDATRDLQYEFLLGPEEAREIHLYWIATFDTRHPLAA